MTFRIFVILVIFGACFNRAFSEFIVSFGETSNHLSGETTIVERYLSKPPQSTGLQLNETFLYPEGYWLSIDPWIIRGVKVLSRTSIQPEITIDDGGIGAQFVTMRVISPRGHGIDCVFRFYETIMSEAEQHLEHETNRSDNNAIRTEDNNQLVIADYIGGEFEIDLI